MGPAIFSLGPRTPPSGYLPPLFPEHTAEQIAAEFPMNTWVLLLSSCFRDFEYIYTVLVNAKDKAWNAALTPPSLPPIFSPNTGMGQTPPIIVECATIKI